MISLNMKIGRKKGGVSISMIARDLSVFAFLEKTLDFFIKKGKRLNKEEYCTRLLLEYRGICQ